MDSDNDKHATGYPTSTLMYEEPTTYVPRLTMPSYKVEKEKMDFIHQLEMFTSRAICTIRAVMVLWSLAKCLSVVSFLLGVCTRIRCLFIPHLILDALFIVVLFILRYVFCVVS